VNGNPAADSTEDGEIAEGEPLPWHHYIPCSLLILAMAVAFALKFFSAEEGMIDWAISREGLFSGNFTTLQLHMFAHGSIIHIVMNGIALFSIGAIVVQKLGGDARAWAKLLFLFEVSGLAGAIAFLSIHQWDNTPMLGASGAIYGLLGFLLRLPKNGGAFIPIWSSDMFKIVVDLIKDHFWLFLMFGLPPLLMGHSGGLAWEAHLGGFLAGIILAPHLGFSDYHQQTMTPT
jgi:membrane associated rhomboid family serine protease